MVVATTGGWGRTGNVYWSLRNATLRAHACKLRLTLPATDAIGHAFQPEETTRLFDFSTREGMAHPDCGNASLAAGMRGDMRKYWFLPQLPNTTAQHAAFFSSYDPELPQLDSCMMWYIGRCHPGYCNGLEHLKDKLVAHIRQGDVFPANFSRAHVHPLYGQPPLSYYLAAFNHRPWSEVIVVSAPTKDVNPVWAGLEVLSSSGIAKVPMRFQASASWGEDFRTLMCARNFVESHSTLHDVLQLGMVRAYYSWYCFTGFNPAMDVYQIAVEGEEQGEYKPFHFHDNSAAEWVDTLLHFASTPHLCPKGG